jgi:hypothetical protein
MQNQLILNPWRLPTTGSSGVLNLENSNNQAQ